MFWRFLTGAHQESCLGLIFVAGRVIIKAGDGREKSCLGLIFVANRVIIKAGDEK